MFASLRFVYNRHLADIVHRIVEFSALVSFSISNIDAKEDIIFISASQMHVFMFFRLALIELNPDFHFPS